MSSPALAPIPPKRILVVEDDLVAAQTLRVVLTVDGHCVEIAGDGEQALTMFENAHDLVITDFKLPKMDGLEVAQAIKERAPSCPVILITAYAESVQSSMGKVSNVDFLIGKPFTVDQLHQTLRKIFCPP
jgi:CheY-like chemotaxis protein